MICAVAEVSFTAHMWCPYATVLLCFLKWGWSSAAFDLVQRFQFGTGANFRSEAVHIKSDACFGFLLRRCTRLLWLTHLLFLYTSYLFCGFPRGHSLASPSPLSLVDLAALSFPLIRLPFLFFWGLISIAISPSCVLSSDPCLSVNEGE